MWAMVLWLAAAPPDLSATGVVVSSRPERSVVLLRSGGRTRLASPGDTAFGGRVVSISASGAALQFGEETVTVTLSAAGGAGSAGAIPVDTLPAGASPASTAAAASRAASPARSPGSTGNDREMTRADVQQRLASEVPRILSETTLLPVMQEGKVAGFTVTRVPQDSLLTEAGLQAGDVLTRVNGVPIDSMATLLGLWPKLQTEPVLRADVLRNGQPLALTVTLR